MSKDGLSASCVIYVPFESSEYIDYASVDFESSFFADDLPSDIVTKKTKLTYNSYIFKNRSVPAVPDNFKLFEQDSFVITVDEDSNSWTWLIKEDALLDVASFAAQIDKKRHYYDLDFVFVSLSQDYINSLGFGAVFQESASYLSAFDAFFTTNGLQLIHKGITMDFTFEKTRSQARVLSSPVIRTTAFKDFVFKTVDRIPYEQTVVNEGVSTTSYQFIEAGFSLKGRLYEFSDHLRLDLEQSNGNPSTDSADGIPTIEEQFINTSLDLRIDQWTVAGGVRTSRLLKSKGLLSKRDNSSDDLLYIFVRPRDRVRSIPRAIPLDEYSIFELSEQDRGALLPPLKNN